MKISHRSASRCAFTPLSRALICALLIGIVCAVTFGSAHSHIDGPHEFEVQNAYEQASLEVSAQHDRHSHTHECLLCLLHQQFSNSIVPEPPFIEKPSADIAFAPAQTDFCYSNLVASSPIARLSGRAPPAA
jgi:hypothetical protein